MRRLQLCLFILVINLSACNNLKLDPTHSTLTEAEYLSHHDSAFSGENQNIHFQPNEVISTDELLENQIRGKIKQYFPTYTSDVIVDGNRIIISSLYSEDDQKTKGIRNVVGKLGKGREIIIVTDEVFGIYRNTQNKIKYEN